MHKNAWKNLQVFAYNLKEIILNRGLDLFVKEEECEPLQHVITSPIPVPQTDGEYLEQSLFVT